MSMLVFNLIKSLLLLFGATMKDISGLLMNQVKRLKETIIKERNEQPPLQTLEKEYMPTALDVEKNYSEIYRARLKELKPIVKAAAYKKWDKERFNYNDSLHSIKIGVFLFITHSGKTHGSNHWHTV